MLYLAPRSYGESLRLTQTSALGPRVSSGELSRTHKAPSQIQTLPWHCCLLTTNSLPLTLGFHPLIVWTLSVALGFVTGLQNTGSHAHVAQAGLEFNM